MKTKVLDVPTSRLPPARAAPTAAPFSQKISHATYPRKGVIYVDPRFGSLRVCARGSECGLCRGCSIGIGRRRNTGDGCGDRWNAARRGRGRGRIVPRHSLCGAAGRSAALAAAGSARRVDGRAGRIELRDGTAIEDAFDITLSYPGANGKGLLAHCRTSYLACHNAPRFVLHGTKGSFVKHGLDPQEPALVGGAPLPKLGSPDVWLQEDESAWGTLTVAPNSAAPETLVNSQVKTELGDYRGFYANVRDAILGAAPLALTAEDGFRVIRLLELARQSSAEGRTLKVKL